MRNLGTVEMASLSPTLKLLIGNGLMVECRKIEAAVRTKFFEMRTPFPMGPSKPSAWMPT